LKRVSFLIPNDELAEFFVEDAKKTDGLIAFTDDNGTDHEMVTEGMTIADA
jgi:hypothetical protein